MSSLFAILTTDSDYGEVNLVSPSFTLSFTKQKNGTVFEIQPHQPPPASAVCDEACIIVVVLSFGSSVVPVAAPHSSITVTDGASPPQPLLALIRHLSSSSFLLACMAAAAAAAAPAAPPSLPAQAFEAVKGPDVELVCRLVEQVGARIRDASGFTLLHWAVLHRTQAIDLINFLVC